MRWLITLVAIAVVGAGAWLLLRGTNEQIEARIECSRRFRSCAESKAESLCLRQHDIAEDPRAYTVLVTVVDAPLPKNEFERTFDDRRWLRDTRHFSISCSRFHD